MNNKRLLYFFPYLRVFLFLWISFFKVQHNNITVTQHRQLIRNYYCNPTQLPTYYPYIPDLSCLHVKSKIHLLNYAMMIICSLIKIITIHTHTHKKNQNDIAYTNNYCNVLTQYIHSIPYVHTIMYYNDVYVIYHKLIITCTNYN